MIFKNFRFVEVINHQFQIRFFCMHITKEAGINSTFSLRKTWIVFLFLSLLVTRHVHDIAEKHSQLPVFSREVTQVLEQNLH